MMTNSAVDFTHSKPLYTIPTPLFSRLETIVLTIGMVIAFFGCQSIGIYLAGKVLLPASDSLSAVEIMLLGSADGTVISVSLCLCLLLLTVLTFAIIAIKGGNNARYLALTSFSWVVGAVMLGLLLVFMVVSQVLTDLLAVETSDFIDPLYASVHSVWLLVLAIVIIAPIYEELVFRGIIWRAIADQFSLASNGALVASVITSVIFAVIHLQYGLYEISTIILLALLFCYARFKSGSLLLPILLHIINNALAMWLYVSQVV